MTSIFDDNSLKGQIGALLLPTIVGCGVLHALFGLAVGLSLWNTDVRLAAALPLLFLVVGAVYSAFIAGPIGVLIACVNYALKVSLSSVATAAYVVVLVLLVFFFSIGRVATLYSM